MSFEIIDNKSWGIKNSAKNSPAALSEFHNTDDGEIADENLRSGKFEQKPKLHYSRHFKIKFIAVTSPLKNKGFSSLAQGKLRQEQRPLDLRDKHFPPQ